MSEGLMSSFLSRRRVADGQEKTDSPKDTSTTVPPKQLPDGAQKANELLALSGPPQLDEKEDVVECLVRQMDIEALKFLTLVGNDDRDGDGKLIVDLKTRIEVFKNVKDWLSSRRHAADPEEKKDQGGGFQAYKQQQDTPKKGADGKFLPRDPDAPPSERKKPGRKPNPDSSSSLKKAGATPNDADTLMARMRALKLAPEQGS